MLKTAARPQAQIITELVSPISRFYERCAARSAAEPQKFVDDLLGIASQRRRQTRPTSDDNSSGGRAGLMIEHGETLPFDDLPASSISLRLDPDSCEL
jgi:hypothetical protein